MSLTESLRRDVFVLCREHGDELTLRREVSSGYDVASGKTTTTTTDYDILGVPLAYSDSDVDGDRILDTDVKLNISDKDPDGVDLTVTPERGDYVVGLDETMRIVSVRRIYRRVSGSVAYICQLRE